VTDPETEHLAAASVALALGHRACPACDNLPGLCCRCHGVASPAAQEDLVPDLVEQLRQGLPEPREHILCGRCHREQVSELEDLRRDAYARGGKASLSELEREVFGKVREALRNTPYATRLYTTSGKTS
jgi:hypothetical protein